MPIDEWLETVVLECKQLEQGHAILIGPEKGGPWVTLQLTNEYGEDDSIVASLTPREAKQVAEALLWSANSVKKRGEKWEPTPS